MLRYFVLLLGAGALAGCSVLPESAGRGPAPRSRVESAPRISNDPAARQCFARLGAAQVRFDPLPDRYYGDGCSTLGAVQLAAVHSDTGTIGLANLGPVTCELADVFERWARYGVDRAARQLLGSGVRTIETFGSYSCRNVAGTSRRSGHATASAIDISGFVLADGRRITVKQDWNGGTPAEREFLRIVHRSACKRFATVLGPEYNAAHEDHLHLEGVLSGSGYCR
jgi:hypothetical protein